MLKRSFDFTFSLIGFIILFPFLFVIGVLIILDSKGGALYIQKRVGRNFKEFGIIKFRTMVPNSDQVGLLTVGSRDSRITKIGFFLRKNKIDELPQLLNVLLGDMSFVGPRPEVKKYVDSYNEDQQEVLNVRPGVTDIASISYSNENELLSKYSDPEKAYIQIIMPDKLKLNLEYIQRQSFISDFKIIVRTIFKLFKR